MSYAHQLSKLSLSCSAFYGASLSTHASHRDGVSYVTEVRVGCINLRSQAEDDECAERTCARGLGERGRRIGTRIVPEFPLV